MKKKKEVHQYLCDNFNTPEVIKVLLELVKMTNVYIKESNVRIFIVNAIVNYIDSMLKVFGLGEERFAYDFSGTEKSKEEILTPVLDVFTGFRDKVRAAARTKDIAMVLNECDQVRDETLPPLGIRMEDTSGASVWKLADVEVLLQEREAKRAELIKREADKLEREKSKREKEEKAKIEPKNLFINQLDKYSKFDETGIPTYDEQGKEISASQRKKLLKEYQKQAEIYEAWKQKNTET